MNKFSVKPWLCVILATGAAHAVNAADAGAGAPSPTPRTWSPHMATPLTPERIAVLPEPARGPWKDYLERSLAEMARYKNVLEAEEKAKGLAEPVPAPHTEADFTVDTKKPAEWFASTEAAALASTVVSFQTPGGGWSKMIDYSKGPRAAGMSWFPIVAGSPQRLFGGTFDNHSTTEQMKLLALVYEAGGKRAEFREAFLKGLDYILAAQYPNGGWPQFYPLEGSYHDAITFNDNAMTHVMELLEEIANGAPRYEFVDDARREAAKKAFQKGLVLIMEAQFTQDGKPAVWGAQHDPLTLQVTGARLKEPPSLSGIESVNLLRFLMKIKNPPPGLAQCIEGGLAWLSKNGVTGIKETTKEGSTFYEADPGSKTVWWPRFTDPVTGKAIFCGSQDGVIYDSFEEMWNHHDRATYHFYNQEPADFAKDRAAWLKTRQGTAGTGNRKVKVEWRGDGRRIVLHPPRCFR